MGTHLVKIQNKIMGLLLASAAMPAMAEEGIKDGEVDVATATVAAVPATATTVYTPADFARFAPVSALDMLREVPGFTIVAQDQGRGLGQANENVLVNGQRLTSKSLSIEDQLGRIAAANVTRIEIGQAQQFGVPGLSGQVANIVTAANKISGQFEYRVVARPEYAKPSYGSGEISLTGSSGNIEWTAAFTHNMGRGGAGGGQGALIYDADRNLVERRDALVRYIADNPQVSGSLRWTAPKGAIVNLKANYRWNNSRFENDEIRDSVAGVDTFRDFTNRDSGHRYELGADVDFDLGPGRLKLIGLESYNRGGGPATSITTYADGSPATGIRYDQYFRASGEHIARAEYRWPMFGGDWQLDGEAAFNRFSQAADLYQLAPSGGWVLIPYTEGEGGVTEDRYETILSHNRALSNNLTLQVGAGAEYSTISQTGTRGLTRSFWRPKGSLALAWQASEDFDLSLRIARTVGQLSFSDFIAQPDPDKGNENSGNTQLRPQQAWEAELELNKDLGAWGSTTLRAYSHWIEDYVDFIPVPDGESRGNVSSAKLMGVSLNSTIRFEPIGWEGAKLTATVAYENSRLDDPLTGQSRSFSGHKYFTSDATLRYDIPRSDWALGVGYDFNRVKPHVRLFETSRDYEGPIYSYAFIENKDVFGLTVNLQVFNLTGGQAIYTRTAYQGLRDRSPVAFYEDKRLDVSQIIRLSVKGSF